MAFYGQASLTALVGGKAANSAYRSNPFVIEIHDMKSFFIRFATVIVTVTVMLSSLAGCRRQTSTAEEDERPDTSTYRPEATPATQFERDMKYIRDAHFTHVWVFSRKDGRELTKEDSDALRTNAPKVVDWVTTDQNRKVIAGSNFDIDAPQMATLQKRFKIEDYSGKWPGQ
jgi:hypothetical protein